MRVYSGRFSRSLGHSFIGQAPADPPFITMARSGSVPFLNVGEVQSKGYQKLAVSTSQPEIVRIGFFYRNTAAFNPFPDSRLYSWTVSFSGPYAGVVRAIPVEELASGYRLIEDPDVEYKTYLQLPIQDKSESKYGLSSLSTAVEDALNGSYGALEAMSAGDPGKANTIVNVVLSRRDEIRMTIESLRSLYMLGQQYYDEINSNILGPIDGIVAPLIEIVAAAAKGTSKDISSLKSKIEADAEAIAESMARIASSVMDEFSIGYQAILAMNVSLWESIVLFKANPVYNEISGQVQGLEDSLKAGQLLQSAMELTAKGMGITKESLLASGELGQAKVPLYTARFLLKARRFVAIIFSSRVRQAFEKLIKEAVEATVLRPGTWQGPGWLKKAFTSEGAKELTQAEKDEIAKFVKAAYDEPEALVRAGGARGLKMLAKSKRVTEARVLAMLPKYVKVAMTIGDFFTTPVKWTFGMGALAIVFGFSGALTPACGRLLEAVGILSSNQVHDPNPTPEKSVGRQRGAAVAWGTASGFGDLLGMIPSDDPGRQAWMRAAQDSADSIRHLSNETLGFDPLSEDSSILPWALLGGGALALGLYLYFSRD